MEAIIVAIGLVLIYLYGKRQAVTLGVGQAGSTAPASTSNVTSYGTMVASSAPGAVAPQPVVAPAQPAPTLQQEITATGSDLLLVPSAYLGNKSVLSPTQPIALVPGEPVAYVPGSTALTGLTK